MVKKLSMFIFGWLGKMGKRRTAILRSLGHFVSGYDIKYPAKQTFLKFDNLILTKHYDGILICTPPNCHYEYIGYFINHFPLFIEKPIFERPIKVPNDWKNKGFVGCNTRYIIKNFTGNGKVKIIYNHNYDGHDKTDLVHFEDLKNVFKDVEYEAKFESDKRIFLVNGEEVTENIIWNSFVIEMRNFVKYCRGEIQSPNSIELANQTLEKVMFS